MKTLLRALTLAVSPGAVPAFAGEPASLALPCPATRLPEQAAVVHVFDQHDLGQVFDLRLRALHFARRACRPGIGYVRFVTAPGRERDYLARPSRAQAKQASLAAQ